MAGDETHVAVGRRVRAARGHQGDTGECGDEPERDPAQSRRSQVDFVLDEGGVRRRYMLALTKVGAMHTWDPNRNTGDPFRRMGGRAASIEPVNGMKVSFARFS
ncbi:hypothetical protein GCM10018952_37980 [Streptosporangium vulgare]